MSPGDARNVGWRRGVRFRIASWPAGTPDGVAGHKGLTPAGRLEQEKEPSKGKKRKREMA